MKLKYYPLLGNLYEEVIVRLDPHIKTNHDIFLHENGCTIFIKCTKSKRGSIIGWSITYKYNNSIVYIRKYKKSFNNFTIDVVNSYSSKSKVLTDQHLVFFLIKKLMEIFPDPNYNFVKIYTGYIYTRKS